MPDVYLLEPAVSSAWAPFQASRPVAELRAGAWLIRERWEAVADGETHAIFAPDHLHAFVEDGAPPVTPRAAVRGPAIVGRSDFAPSGVAPDLPTGPARLVNDDVTVGWWVPAGATWTEASDDGAAVPLEGMQLHGAYDVVSALEHFLQADTMDFLREGGDHLPDGSIAIGDPNEIVLLGCVVEPGVVFDTRHGAIVIEQHTHVRSGTRLEGPLYIGPGCQVLGGPIAWSAVGPRCKVRGEMTEAVFLGYGNKSHDGFLGHSVIGRWANLGAGTTTSNLKNSYGFVRLQVGSDRIETGRQFLGSLVGDHAKTAIGTMLSTGTIVGAGANLFGVSQAPAYVPPFAWGAKGEVMRLDGFLTTARRVLARRQVEVTDAVEAMLTALYTQATGA
ncbi:MAG: putative sugar nucleotidyl transferase [Gemmatimonadota bacterium]|nr:putative sugar nucleotidyl transferase [Gemmatimonadota bacterium]